MAVLAARVADDARARGRVRSAGAALSSRTLAGGEVEGHEQSPSSSVRPWHDRPPPELRPSCTRLPGSGSHSDRVGGAGQPRDRAVLGRHRHPLVGLGHHRRLACDRVAQHGEAVGACRRRTCRSRRGPPGSPRAPARASRPRASARSGSRRRPRCRCRSGSGSPRAAANGAAGCGSTASRCGRGTGRGRSRTGASARS